MSTELDLQTLLAGAKDIVLGISAAAVTAFESRCVLTRGECEGLHLSACRSRLPEGECTTTGPCPEDTCGSVHDLSNPVVQVPASMGGSTGDIIADLDVIETICYGIIVNNELIQQYEDSQSPDSVSTVFTYFGSWNGVMRTFPGMNFDGSECGDYDPRIRPWYVAASSGPKDVVIIVDISGSMEKNERFALANDAVQNVLATMNENTFVNIVLFESKAEVLTSGDRLVAASDENKEMLLELLAEVTPRGSTNYEEALATTFNLLEASRELGDVASTGCTTAILLLTDGEITQGLGFEDASEIATFVQDLNADIGAQIFTFALGPEADSTTLKTIACGSGGIFQAIPDGGALSTAMSFYYRYYAIGLGGNTGYTAYSSVYQFSPGFGGEDGFSIMAPAYDRAFDPPAFLGVAGVDFMVQPFLDLGFTLGEIEDAVFAGGGECPSFNLTDCQLQQFRGSISAESVCPGSASCGSVDVSLEPVRCMEEEEYPDTLWSNVDLEELDWDDRSCCGFDTFDPSIATPTCAFDDAPGGIGVSTGIVAGSVVGVCAVVALVFIAYKIRKKKTNERKASKAQQFALPAMVVS